MTDITKRSDSEILNYMIQHEFIKKDSTVESDLVIKDMSRRTQNFQVAGKNGRSYLVKYGGIDKGKTSSISHEASIYRLLKQIDRANDHINNKNNTYSSKYLPDFYYYDRLEHLLILELFPKAKPCGNTIFVHVGFLVSLLPM